VPGVLDGYRLFTCAGHDEYWSWGMREALDAHTGAGGNAAIWSGNTCYWQVRFDHDAGTMTCFKYRSADDPVLGTDEERRLSGPWSDRRVGWPETQTIGLTFTRGGYSRYGLGVPRASGAFTVRRPDHWLFDGTDLRYGDALGLADAIVAYEVDGCAMTLDDDGLPTPTHVDGAPETLGGEAWREHVGEIANNHAVVGAFTTPGGGTVVNVGVTDWTYGLADPIVDRVTRNALERLG
jgi:hypothetical protein